MTFWQFTIFALACYRLTVLIARDAGPSFFLFEGGIFKWLRSLDKGTKMLKCPYCVSVWVAIGIETAAYFSGIKDLPVVIVCIVFSLSAVAIILDRCFTADHQA